jgi:hypothetical protein
LGFPTGSQDYTPTSSFLVPLPGRKRISARGVSHFQSFYFVIVLLCFFTLFSFASFYQKYKKLVPFIVGTLLLYFYFIMLIPKYILKDLSVGSGSIIGKDNIEEFFNHVRSTKILRINP